MLQINNESFSPSQAIDLGRLSEGERHLYFGFTSQQLCHAHPLASISGGPGTRRRAAQDTRKADQPPLNSDSGTPQETPGRRDTSMQARMVKDRQSRDDHSGCTTPPLSSIQDTPFTITSLGGALLLQPPPHLAKQEGKKVVRPHNPCLH